MDSAFADGLAPTALILARDLFDRPSPLAITDRDDLRSQVVAVLQTVPVPTPVQIESGQRPRLKPGHLARASPAAPPGMTGLPKPILYL
jgi:hypothetical protein